MFGRVIQERHSGRLLYRFRVPRSLAPALGRTELKRSLKTRDRAVAERRALTLARHAIHLLDDVRVGMLDDSDIRARVHGFFQAELDADLRDRAAFSSAPGWAPETPLPFEPLVVEL